MEVQCEGEDVTRLVEAKSHDSLPLLRNPQMLVGANDLTTLSYLHEPAGTVYVCMCALCVLICTCLHLCVCVLCVCVCVDVCILFTLNFLTLSQSPSFTPTYSPFSPFTPSHSPSLTLHPLPLIPSPHSAPQSLSEVPPLQDDLHILWDSAGCTQSIPDTTHIWQRDCGCL